MKAAGVLSHLSSLYSFVLFLKTCFYYSCVCVYVCVCAFVCLPGYSKARGPQGMGDFSRQGLLLSKVLLLFS